MFQTRPPEDHIDTVGKCGNPHYNNMALTAGQAAFLSDTYDAGIRFADDCLGSFVKYLESRNAFRNTVLVIVSDHGEEFKEHGKIGHERTLYMECLRVATIFVAPGLTPRVVQETTGLVDVMPTILELLSTGTQDIQGKSLLPLMRGASEGWKPKMIVSELDRHLLLRSISDGVFHLIIDLRAGRRELFNIKDDPGEHTNLAATQPEKVDRFEELLQAYIDSARGEHAPAKAEPDSEHLKRLRSLGYAT